MAIDHFVGDGRRHIVEGKRLGLAGDLAVIDDLQQQVAEFFLQRRQVVTLDGIGDLVGFLDRVWRDRAESLVDVPGATMLTIAQPGHDREQPRERFLGQGFRSGLACSHGVDFIPGYRIIYIMTNTDYPCESKHYQSIRMF